MDFPRDPPKLKSLTSLFFGKKEKRQSMQGPPPPPLEPGLKTLTTLAANHNRSLSCKKPNILSFSSTANPSSSSSSSSSSLSSLASPPSTSPSTSSLMDDVEDYSEEKEAVACDAASADADGNRDERKEEEEAEEAPQMQSSLRRRRRRSSQKEREFPPPIPHLARTGNLPCHMPWVLKRSYIDNGRLVIREVKVKHHEYFRAHRANGRLTLQIMQLDDSAASLPWRSPANSTDSPEITEKTDGNSPSSSLSSSASASSSLSAPSSPSAAQEDDECGSIIKINAPEGRSNIPPLLSPSSLPSSPSMSSKELKNILDVNRGCSCQGRCSISRDDTIGGTRDVMEMGTLPSILSSSMPESSFGIGGGGSSRGGGGGGGCCCLNKRSNSLFSTPIPTIRPVHS